MGKNYRSQNGEQDTIEATEAEATERKGRKTLDVGTVTIGRSERTIVKRRKSKLDTDPVAVGVRDAEAGVNYDIAFEPGKSKAIVSTLRRAGQHYNRGVNIPLVDEEARVVVFNVGDRKTRKAKSEVPASEQATPSEPQE